MAGDERASGGRRQWRGRVGLVLLALLLLLLGGVWTQRKPIARDYVDRALAARDVPARYRITRLGVSSQRLEAVVIGDPARPDLTADWVELRLSYGLGAPTVSGVVAGGVRLRGRLVDGRVTLGAVDRLLPPPTGAPFTLPDLAIVLSDARMRLETAAGAIGLTLDGGGRLTGGFTGKLAAYAPRLAAGGCVVGGASAFVDLAVVARKPVLDGPVRAATLVCDGGVEARRVVAALDLTLGAALDRWRGAAGIEAASVQGGAYRLRDLDGHVDFAGDARGTAGAIRLAGLAAGAAGDGRGAFGGRYALAPGDRRLTGRVMLAEATLAPALLQPALTRLGATRGTPLAPLAPVLGAAVRRAGARFVAAAEVDLRQAAGQGRLKLRTLEATSASGARLAIAAGEGIELAWPAGGMRLDGSLRLAGGGLPAIDARLRQAAPRAPIRGEVRVAPLAADGARLALAPLRFTADRGATRFATALSIDGPLAGGRVEGLSLPVAGRIAPGGALAINPDCAPLTFRQLSVAGARFGATRLSLCPRGPALIASGAGGASGGAIVAAPRLAGQLGGEPLTVAADRLAVLFDTARFAADRLDVRLGEDATRIAVERLVGAFDADGVGGRFFGLGGRIARVPVLLADGVGDWRLASSVVTVAGALRVADEAASPRFYPLRSDDVRLRFADGVIRAEGSLLEPVSGARVTDVAIVHRLDRGSGSATLAVPSLQFTEALQPEALTPLTLGVVANVAGTVRGAGRIDWNPAAITSTGDFTTEGLDLAAAFGPVRGLAGTVHFSDLLALATPPGQRLTVAEINPGIAVRDGVFDYQLLPGQQVQIAGARWPFSGGTLTLDPTRVDFGQPSERKLTFRVAGMDAARFVEQFELNNIAVTGIFDGVLPMLFDERGGRIVAGRLRVRQGGGTVAYVGAVSNADLGMFGQLAFDALKSMRYRSLTIELDGALEGDFVSRVLFDGTNQTPPAARRGGLLGKLTGLPFRFNIVIRAPFRGLLNAAQSFSDPRGLLGTSLPAPDAPVQPR